MSDRESDLRRARALGDRTRQAIYLALRDAAGPLDVEALTALVGTHHTAVRQHLAKLEDAGLVVEERLPITGRGRPRIGYRAAAERADGAPYRTLAGLLAAAVRTGEGVREAGRAAGRRQPAPAGSSADPAPRSPVEALADQAAQLGFEPEIQPGPGDRSTILLRACPFADVAADAPEVVCDLHLGIAEGLAETIGGLTVEALHPGDPHAAGCRLEVCERPDREPRDRLR